MYVKPGHAPCDRTKDTKGNLGQAGNSIHVEDHDDQVVSEQELYGLKMQEGSNIVGHINVFSQMVTDLEQLGVKIETEDKAIILPCSPPSSYEHVVKTLTYGKESIKVEDITAVLLARELRIKNGAVDGPLGDALLVRGEQSKEKVKEKKKKVRCYDCGELGHVRRDCPDKYQKASANIAMSKSDSDSDGDVLSVSDSMQSTKAWMLDSASSFSCRSGSLYTNLVIFF
jgi:hypothetical protein